MFGNYQHPGLQHFGVNHFGNFGLLPTQARVRPMLHRVPGVDNRLARFTELLSAIVNSVSARGQLILVGQNDYTLATAHLALIDPTTSDDSSLGHFAGQLWINLVTSNVFCCINALPGAVEWISLIDFAGSVDGGIWT